MARSKPLLFGETIETEAERAWDMDTYAAAAGNPHWVRGYDEHRAALDLMKAEYGSMTHRLLPKLLKDLGFNDPSEVKAPPVELMWGRVSALDGTTNDNIRLDMRTHTANGYKAITAEELKALGMSVPETCHVAADGTIRRGDVALMAVDAERASANEKRRRAAVADLEANDAALSGNETGVNIDFERERIRNYNPF